MPRIELRRQDRRRALISLVPMVDVMMIMLIFFMVTSSYLDLDMVPAVHQDDQPPMASAGGPSQVYLVRISAEGLPVVRGQTLALETFASEIADRLQKDPLTQVVLLPSGEANMQALISVMDRATKAGVVRLRVIRLEAQR